MLLLPIIDVVTPPSVDGVVEPVVRFCGGVQKPEVASELLIIICNPHLDDDGALLL